jgi:poly-gamma-glutamate synthesis protein (capsule biosynthesis protein)
VAGRTVSILGAGDILAHPELWDQARRDGGGVLDFGPMLAAARDTISGADLALCHLETPLAPPGGPYIGFPRFSVPQEVAKGIKSVGYDGCSTASNHSIDQGYDGIKRTLDVLDQAGLGHTGTYLSAKAAKQPKIYQVKGGVRVAHLSYTKNFNGLSRPAGQDWVANLIDPKKIEHDADAARAAGAEIVVVSLHWGTEYEHEPDVDQQTWARQVAAISNVDLVFGHHAHVVQPVEHIGGKWIVYGMGNQIARHAEPVNDNRDGAMIRVTFSPATAKRWKVAAIEAIPTFVDLNPDIRLVDLERSLADPTLPPGRRRIYEAAVDRIQGSLVTRSADDLGLIVRGAATN